LNLHVKIFGNERRYTIPEIIQYLFLAWLFRDERRKIDFPESRSAISSAVFGLFSTFSISLDDGRLDFVNELCSHAHEVPKEWALHPIHFVKIFSQYLIRVCPILRLLVLMGFL